MTTRRNGWFIWPDEQMKVANLSRQIQDLESRLAPCDAGLGATHGKVGGDRYAAIKRSGVCAGGLRLTRFRPVAKGICLRPMARSLPRVYAAPRSTRAKLTMTNDLQNITAFRFGTPYRPESAVQRPGPAPSRGNVRPNRVQGPKPSTRMIQRNKVAIKFFQGKTADFEQP